MINRHAEFRAITPAVARNTSHASFLKMTARGEIVARQKRSRVFIRAFSDKYPGISKSELSAPLGYWVKDELGIWTARAAAYEARVTASRRDQLLERFGHALQLAAAPFAQDGEVA